VSRAVRLNSSELLFTSRTAATLTFQFGKELMTEGERASLTSRRSPQDSKHRVLVFERGMAVSPDGECLGRR